MRKLLLTAAAVAAAIAGAVAVEPTHSENADSSYADYCIKIEDSDTTLVAKFLLVKKYRNLEPIRIDSQMTFWCTSVSGSDRYYFDIVEEKISELRRKLTHIGISVEGSAWGAGVSDGKLNLGPVIPISHIDTLRILNIKDRNKENWKKGLLPLKEITYTNAKVKAWRNCSPLDTTFQVNYRVRLIGECK